MSFRTSSRSLPQQFRLVLTSFLQVSGLAFAGVLDEDDIQRACDEEGVDFGQNLVDGTTVSMPDTEEHQEAYPQHGTQQKSVGFPISRMVVLLSLATGMVTGMALGPWVGPLDGPAWNWWCVLCHRRSGRRQRDFSCPDGNLALVQIVCIVHAIRKRPTL